MNMVEGGVVYLEHEEDGIQNDEGHDEVLEGRGFDEPPQLILVTIPFLSGEQKSSFSLSLKVSYLV